MLIDPALDSRRSPGLIFIVRPAFVTIEMITDVDDHYVDMQQFAVAATFHGWALPRGFYTAIRKKQPKQTTTSASSLANAEDEEGYDDVPSSKGDPGSGAAQLNVALKEMLAALLIRAYVQGLEPSTLKVEIEDPDDLKKLDKQIGLDMVAVGIAPSAYKISRRLEEVISAHEVVLTKFLNGKSNFSK